MSMFNIPSVTSTAVERVIHRTSLINVVAFNKINTLHLHAMSRIRKASTVPITIVTNWECC